MPLGKYIVYEKLKEKNLPISIQSMREHDVDTVLADAGITASDLFAQDYVSMHGMSSSNPSDSTTPMDEMPGVQQTMMQQQNNGMNHSNSMVPKQQSQYGNSIVPRNSINMNNSMTQSQSNIQMPIHSMTQPPGRNISPSSNNVYSGDSMSNQNQGTTTTSTNTFSHMGM